MYTGKKSWVPNHGLRGTRTDADKVWMVRVDQNIHLLALKRHAGHEQDRRAPLVKPSVPEPSADRQIVCGPPFQFGARHRLHRNTLRYGDFDHSLGLGDDSKIGMHENFKQSARVGLSRVNDTLSN